MKEPKCAKCKTRLCTVGITEKTKLPDFCPMKNYKSLVKKITKKYKTTDIAGFYIASALTEKECFNKKAAREEGKLIPLRPRIREIAEFAKKLGAKKIGMACCSGLYDEAARANKILESHGLNVCSVMCKCGSIDKTEAGLLPEHKIIGPEKFETACNPLLQAELLNKAGTTFNVIVGLCVGHDMLFTKFCEAPVTTLIAKDRLTGHNPVISLYLGYHKHIV